MMIRLRQRELGHDRPPSTARADHDRDGSFRVDDRARGVDEASPVGVVADEEIAFALDAVHGAGQPRSVGYAVQQRHDRNLVRHRYVDSRQAECPNAANRVGERSGLDLEADVASINSGCLECRLDHLLGRVPGDRLADQAEEPCGCRGRQARDRTAGAL